MVLCSTLHKCRGVVTNRCYWQMTPSERFDG
jgi:hypothetical protein